MGQEALSVDGWIADTVLADGVMQGLIGDRFYVDEGPDLDALTDAALPTEFPRLVLTFVSGLHRNAVGGIKFATNVVVEARAVSMKSYGECGPIMERFDQLFAADGQSPGALYEGVTVGRLIPERVVKRPEYVRKVKFFNLGNEYRLIAF